MQILNNSEIANGSSQYSSRPVDLTHPFDHVQRIAAALKREAVDRQGALVRTLEKMQAILQLMGPDIQLFGRIKSFVSISAKMLNKGLGVHQVLDIIGVRFFTQQLSSPRPMRNREPVDARWDDGSLQPLELL